jgi:hypothetical protein
MLSLGLSAAQIWLRVTGGRDQFRDIFFLAFGVAAAPHSHWEAVARSVVDVCRYQLGVTLV